VSKASRKGVGSDKKGKDLSKCWNAQRGFRTHEFGIKEKKRSNINLKGGNADTKLLRRQEVRLTEVKKQGRNSLWSACGFNGVQNMTATLEKNKDACICVKWVVNGWREQKKLSLALLNQGKGKELLRTKGKKMGRESEVQALKYRGAEGKR